jgi:hypothetical protein
MTVKGFIVEAPGFHFDLGPLNVAQLLKMFLIEIEHKKI